MFDLFIQYPFLLRALLAAVLIGGVCGAVGSFVVFNRMSFFADAVAHSALTGIAVGILFNVMPFWTAILVGLLVAVGVVFLKNSGRFSTDTVLGIFMPSAMALGIVLMSFKSGYAPDLMSFLFGSILSVSWTDLLIELVIGGVALGVMIKFYWPLLYYSFDREAAVAAGIDVDRLEYLFVIVLSAVVVASLQVVGIILVGAMIVIPAAAAKNIGKSFGQVVWAGGAIGLLGSLLGLLLSISYDLSTGSVIVLVLVFLFIITYIFRRK